jgi:hypothetical protein
MQPICRKVIYLLRSYVLLGILTCVTLISVGCKEKHAPNNTDTALEKYNQSVALAFQALLFWETGQTNRYIIVIMDPGFDKELRNCLVVADKTGKQAEIEQSLNSYIDLWIIVFSGSAINHDWPSSERDPVVFDLVRRIAEYRKKHLGLISGDDVNKNIKQTLENVLLRAEAMKPITNSPPLR